MKIPLFILNIVSAVLLLVLALSDPSITGLAINPTDPEFTLTSPLGFATMFIITTISIDIYFYMKSRKDM